MEQMMHLHFIKLILGLKWVDVIILDDNFSTTVNVAELVRSVYSNIQKFVQFS